MWLKIQKYKAGSGVPLISHPGPHLHPPSNSPQGFLPALAYERISKSGFTAFTWHKTHSILHTVQHLLLFSRWISRISASFLQLRSTPMEVAPTPISLACITLDLKGLSMALSPHLPCRISRGRPALGPRPAEGLPTPASTLLVGAHSAQVAPPGRLS